ncbi:MAG: hypothetical protein WCS96_01285 [Victivallales bacterium]
MNSASEHLDDDLLDSASWLTDPRFKDTHVGDYIKPVLTVGDRNNIHTYIPES